MNNDIYIEHLKLITKNFLYSCKLNEETPTFENLNLAKY
jgi:hypothetical protein